MSLLVCGECGVGNYRPRPGNAEPAYVCTVCGHELCTVDLQPDADERIFVDDTSRLLAVETVEPEPEEEDER